MSRGTLRYDSTGMRSLWNELRTVRAEFDNADEHSGAAAEAVGHAGLADRVRSFSSGWDGMRGELSDAIGRLAETASKLDEAFNESERALAASMTGEQR